MPVTININGLTLVHRGSEGRIHNTLPDVCRTPSKGRAVPYENEAYSKDLIKGTTTVFADGGNMIANLGSEIGVSVFDEPGTMGGVKSGTNMAEADWITHSFDVFFEGKAACRLTDKMFMNHRNTVSLAGWQQASLTDAQNEIQQFVCDCNKEVQPSAGDNCMSLGNKKHDCVDEKKRKSNQRRQANGKKPLHQNERGYRMDSNGNLVRENGRPRIDDIAARRVQRADTISRLGAIRNTLAARVTQANAALQGARDHMARTIRGSRALRGSRGAGSGVRGAMRGVFAEALGQSIAAGIMESQARAGLEQAQRAAAQAALDAERAAAELARAEADAITRRAGYKYPDGAVLDGNGKIRELSEYKFPCPNGVPTGSRNKQGVPSMSRGTGQGNWGRGQQGSYQDLLDDLIAGGEADSGAKLNKYTTTKC